MIVAELALLTERHGEASKEVKMPLRAEFRQAQLPRSRRSHQYSGKFFAKTENKSQNHQNSNLHHLYIASILTKLQVIYDAMVCKAITTRFRNWIASIYIQEAKERDAISDRRDRFLGQTATIYIQEGVQRQATSDTPDGTLRDRFHNRTQKFWFIYDATVRRSITTRFRNGIASTYVQEAKERDAISDTLTVDWCDRSDTPFLECPTGLYGTLRERSIHDAITQQPQSIYDATEWRSINPGSKNQTQKSWSIYDAMVWANLSIGDGIAPHPILSMTERHKDRYFIYDGMS